MGKTILIVDDAAFMRMMIKDILSKNGYDVLGEAQTGKEAVELYQKLKPDLVTMDITMPDMDGIKATAGILNEFPDARIVMVTSHGQEKMVLDALAAGACGYILKPIRIEKLKETIAQAFERMA